MEHRIASPVLWGRALLTGSFACFLGLADHVVTDAAVPGVGALIVLIAASMVASAPLLARPASAWRTLVSLISGQVLIHLGLALSADPREGLSLAASGHASHGAGLLEPHLVIDLAGHVAAAAVIALWLAYGERRVVTALHLTARRLLTLLFPVVPAMTPGIRRATSARLCVVYQGRLLGRRATRRGPPALAC